MDIQKEREAFESAMFKLADGQTKNEINPVNGQYMYGVMEVMWKVWQAARAQAVQEKPHQFNLDEFLSMEEKLKSKGGIIKADLDRFIVYAEMVLEKAKSAREPK